MEDPAARLMRGLTEALVLDSLDREPQHGYGLMQELEAVFGEAPNRNRIYPLLSRLEEEGYIRGHEDPDSSRGKTTYTLTEAGEDRLETYRSMPDAFRETLGRFWGAPTGADEGVAAAEDAEGAGDGGEGRGSGGTEPGSEADAPGTGGAGDPEAEGGDREAATGDGDGGGPPEGGGEEPPDQGASDGEQGGMDLRRNPETGEVEMVIRGTHWGEVRIELGEIRRSGEDG